MSEKIYGIDLGTTNSAIALYSNEEAEIIANADGDEITPSVVYFTGCENSEGEDEALVGTQAKNSAGMDPDNVVQFIKRYIGDCNSRFNHIAPSGKEYSPEMISALILKKLCAGAELKMGERVKNVVITVPAYFDDARRTATKQAGKIAGLNVLRVINEPTAAAIAYGVDSSQNGKILVYDLGGGTFDVTILKIADGNFDVVATAGDPKLGGINFDQKMLSIIIHKLEEQGCTIDDENDALIADLREKAEAAKIQLTSVEQSRPFFNIDGKRCKVVVSRDEFEEECKQFMQRTQFMVESTLKDANLTWDDINQVIMVGGSTKMPMVKKMLEMVSGKPITRTVNQDTAVAIGASIFASTLIVEGESCENSLEPYSGVANKIVISDVTSQSLGVVTVDGFDNSKMVNTIIIPHNTKIPTRCSETVFTVNDYQTVIKIEVTEGDDLDLEYVKIIGSSTLSIPAYPKGSPVEIVYAYDPDQTIYVEAIDGVTHRSLGTFEIERKSNLSAEEVNKAQNTINKTTVE